jgi:hypothetical protein
MEAGVLVMESVALPNGHREPRGPSLSDPDLAAASASAIDPLELAARFETVGLSNDVAAAAYGHSDVFSLADAVFAQVPFEAQGQATPQDPPGGGISNLGRGALFAIPTLLFGIVQVGLIHSLTWWSLPLGLTWGWASSQVVSVVGWMLRGRQDHRSDALLPVASLTVCGVMAAGLAFTVRTLQGGDLRDVLFAVVFSVYMVASGLILLEDAGIALAVILTPSVVALLVHYTGWPVTLSTTSAARVAAGSAILAIAFPLRHSFNRGWRIPRLQSSDRRRALAYMAHGACCGILTSAIIFYSNLWRQPQSYKVIFIWPLMLSLGIMEWQLCSFRRDGFHQLHYASDLRRFGRVVRRSFMSHSAFYVVWLLVLSAGAEAFASIHHGQLVLLVTAEALLGVSFFLALVIEASGRIDLTLKAWLATVLLLSAALAGVWRVDGHIKAQVGIVCCLIAYALGSCSLARSAWRVVASPFSY